MAHPLLPKKYLNQADGKGTAGAKGTVSGVKPGKWDRMINDNEPIAKSDPRASINSPKMARRTMIPMLEEMQAAAKRNAALEVVRSGILYMNPLDVAEIVECAAKYDIESALAGLRLMLDSPAKEEIKNRTAGVLFAVNRHRAGFGSKSIPSCSYAIFTESTLLTIDEAGKFTGNTKLKEDIIDAVCGFLAKGPGNENGVNACANVLNLYLKHFDSENAVKTGLANAWSLKTAINTIHRRDGNSGTSLLWNDAKREIDAYFMNKKNNVQQVDCNHVECLALLPEKHQEEENWGIVLAAVDAKLKSGKSASGEVTAIMEAVPPSRRAPYAMIALESPYISIRTALKILASATAGSQADEIWETALKEFKSVAWSAEKGDRDIAREALAEIPQERVAPFREAVKRESAGQAQGSPAVAVEKAPKNRRWRLFR